MATECDAERTIKKAIHRIECDLGNGIVNYSAILNILRQQGEESCAA